MTTSLSDAGLVLSDTSALLNAAIVQGQFKYLRLSANGTTGTVNINADAIVVKSATNSYAVLQSIALTPVAGNLVGVVNGLDSGSWAFSTWYYVYVIYGTAGAGALFSTSSTAPALPSGYTYFARVGAIRTQAATNYYPLAFMQVGRKVRYTVGATGNMIALPQMASGAAGSPTVPTYVAVSTTAYVPATAGIIDCVLSMFSANVATLSPNGNTAVYNSGTNSPPVVNPANVSSYASLLLESSNVYWCSSGTGILACAGWEDNL
jgi:hypothetical protein